MSGEAKATTAPSACPNCGAARLDGDDLLFECGSVDAWGNEPFNQSELCCISELTRENAELRQRLEAAEKLLPFAQHERSCHIITASYLVPFPRCTCGLDGVRDSLTQKVNAEQANRMEVGRE